MSEEPTYKADLKCLEGCTYVVVAEMLERLPKLKPRIKKYLETFPGETQIPSILLWQAWFPGTILLDL